MSTDCHTDSAPPTASASRGSSAHASAHANVPQIALAGNPNTGKTSLFNRLTGSNARVGNYPGVTVELLTGTTELPGLGSAHVVDIPGTYSLVARSAEEQIAIEKLVGLSETHGPDVVVVCVDATNLLRNLYLVLQLQELGRHLIVALTMMDEAEAVHLNPRALEQVLGCAVVEVNSRQGEGIDALKRAIVQEIQSPRALPPWRWTPSRGLEQALLDLVPYLPQKWQRQVAQQGNDSRAGRQAQALALWALMSIDEGDTLQDVPSVLRSAVTGSGMKGDDIDDEVIQARFQWLDRHVGPLVQGKADRSVTDRADAVLIHPVWGFGVFLAIMFVVFQSLFVGADPAISLIESVFGWIGDLANASLPASILTELLVEGVIGGVGSVVVFLPQILLLFFFLGLMEDSGYMARVAYLMDRVMRLMGLNGRAFVPMLSGYACAIPAIMATRTMERPRDRFLTMMVVPLMTCSARLPVYSLLIGALFPAANLMGILPVQGTLMVAMYLFSVLIALFAAWVLSKTVFKAPPVPLVMELPPYRMPRLMDVLRMMWRRTRMFLTEAGTVILVCTILLWGLLSFPRSAEVTTESAPATSISQPDVAAEDLEQVQQGERLRQSYAGRIGHFIEPAIAPLGFDWKIGVGLIGAFAAREVFVSTMGVVYNIGKDVDEESQTLRERMRAERKADGTPVYSPLVGLSLMVFFALACQCISTLAVVKRETGGWKWPTFLLGYMTVLAWVSSFLVYQGGRLLGLG